MLLTITVACYSQNKYPMYDTARGVAVYYDDQLRVRADSVLLIRRADKTICEEFNMIDCGFYGREYYKPFWYEWRIIKTKDRYVVAVRQKISFHPDPKTNY